MDLKKFNYTQAINDIEDIATKIENEELDIDKLSEEVKKAIDLIKACKEKLKKTGKDLEDIIDELDN